jgi:hypothetical protein
MYEENMVVVSDEFRQFKLDTLYDPDLRRCVRYKLEVTFITGRAVNISSVCGESLP